MTTHRLRGGPRGVRVAILSDTHGVLDERVAEEVTRCDAAVHGGDVGGLGVLHALRPRGGTVVAVRGNNDTDSKWPPAEPGQAGRLPEEAELHLPGGRLVVVHGHRVGPARARHDRLRARYPDARCIVYGHSHRLCCDLDGEPWVVNPGAAGRARTYGGPSCVILQACASAWTLEVRRFPLLGQRRSGAGSKPESQNIIMS